MDYRHIQCEYFSLAHDSTTFIQHLMYSSVLYNNTLSRVLASDKLLNELIC